MKSLEQYIISIPDFPQKGIIFRDVTGILNDAEGFKLCHRPFDRKTHRH